MTDDGREEVAMGWGDATVTEGVTGWRRSGVEHENCSSCCCCSHYWHGLLVADGVVGVSGRTNRQKTCQKISGKIRKISAESGKGEKRLTFEHQSMKAF